MNFWARQGLTSRLTILLSLAGALVIAGVFGVNYYLDRQTVLTYATSQAEALEDIQRQSFILASLAGSGFLLLAGLNVLVIRSVTAPLRQLSRSAGRIAQGDLDTPLPAIQRRDEIGQLVQAFQSMQLGLADYIQRLSTETALRERMASELSIAHDLQMAILPRELPQLSGLEVAGCCRPAREVGGDLYDVRVLADGRLFFVIGDVSGKGVPAALYMAITMSLTRAVVQEQAGPAEVLTRINRELAHGNDTCMFVTLFCGMLDSASGEICYANAGHNPPVLMRADGTACLLEIEPCIAAGFLDDYQYHEAHCRLEKGATLLLYTDGVTEAQDARGDFFGEQRLLDVAVADVGTAEQLVAALGSAVERFADGADQADDITMLVLRRSCPESVFHTT